MLRADVLSLHLSSLEITNKVLMLLNMQDCQVSGISCDSHTVLSCILTHLAELQGGRKNGPAVLPFDYLWQGPEPDGSMDRSRSVYNHREHCRIESGIEPKILESLNIPLLSSK